MELKRQIRIAKELRLLSIALIVSLLTAIIVYCIGSSYEQKDIAAFEEMQTNYKKESEEKIKEIHKEQEDIEIKLSFAVYKYDEAGYRRWKSNNPYYDLHYPEMGILYRYAEENMSSTDRNVWRLLRDYDATVSRLEELQIIDGMVRLPYWMCSFEEYRKGLPSWIQQQSAEASAGYAFITVLCICVLCRGLQLFILFLCHGTQWIYRTAKMKEPEE